MVVSSEAKNCPFFVKMSSNETKMKEQCKLFPVDEKMQILAKVNSHVGTQVDLAAMLGLSVSMLNMIVSQQSEIETSYSHCGPSFSKEHKFLKTSPLEKLETIPLVWLKQVRTINPSIDGPHLKERQGSECAGKGRQCAGKAHQCAGKGRKERTCF
jgi:hypothetical protein